MIIAYAAVFSYFTILKYYAFRSYAWDLGIFNQSLWTTLNEGRLFYHTLELFMNPSGSFLAVHFSPILFLVLVPYAALQRPETLLVLQSVVLAIAAYPLYLLVKEEFKNTASIAMIFAVVYLTYPALHGVNWFDFHVQSFLPLFIFSMLYSFRKRNWKCYFTFFALSLMVEEQTAIVLVFWGVYVIWVFRNEIRQKLKEKKLADENVLVPILTMTMSALWLLTARWTKSTFFPIDPTFSTQYLAIDNWNVLGIRTDPMYMPIYVLMNPSKALEALAFDFPLKLMYLIFLLAPLLFMSIRSSSLAIAFAWLAPALLSNNGAYYKLGYQYPAYIIPFLFYAAIQGLKNLSEDNTKMALKMSKTMLIVALILTLSLSPISPLPKFFDATYVPPRITVHDQYLGQIINLIPGNASVLTQNNIFPQISSRSDAYAVYPHAIWASVKRRIVDFTTNVTRNVDYILADLSTEEETFEYALERAKTGDYGVYACIDKIVLFKFNYTGDPIIYEPLLEYHDFSTLKLSNGILAIDNSSRSRYVLFHAENDSSTGFFWFGPYTLLLPGNYTATLRLKTSSTAPANLLTIDVAAEVGKKIIASRDINSGDFKHENTWQNISISFRLDKPVADIETRGIITSVGNSVSLDFIMIQQASVAK
jgi:uncharacterized membrane protein